MLLQKRHMNRVCACAQCFPLSLDFDARYEESPHGSFINERVKDGNFRWKTTVTGFYASVEDWGDSEEEVIITRLNLSVRLSNWWCEKLKWMSSKYWREVYVFRKSCLSSHVYQSVDFQIASFCCFQEIHKAACKKKTSFKTFFSFNHYVGHKYGKKEKKISTQDQGRLEFYK